MKLAVEEIRRVALLARLKLTPEEEYSLTEQLDTILGYMNKLAEVDTTDVQPFTHAMKNDDSLRQDGVTNRPNPDALLANAPDRDNSFFKVPKIIE